MAKPDCFGGLTDSFRSVFSRMLDRLGYLLASYDKKSFLFKLVSILIYRASLDIIYVFIVNPLWEYSTFTLFRAVSPMSYFCSWIAIVLFAPFIQTVCSDENPSSLIINFINFSYFIPLTSYFGCKGSVSAVFFALSLLYWAVLLILQFRVPILRMNPPTFRQGKLFMCLTTFFSCSFVVFVSWKYTGFRLFLDLFSVYDIREEAANYQMLTITKYVLSMIPSVLSIMLIYYCRRKKLLVIATLTFVFLLLFSIAGNKSTFFAMLIVLGIEFFYRNRMIRAWPVLFLLLNLVQILERVIFNSYKLASFFSFRTLYIPVALGEAYFNYFQKNPLNLLREGVFGKLGFDSIYSTNIPRLIGEFVGDATMNANSGLLADAFSNVPPLLAVVIFPFVLIICFRMLDMVSKGHGTIVTLPVAIYFGMGFVNGSWSTILLTNGYIVACLLLYIMPRDMEEPYEIL